MDLTKYSDLKKFQIDRIITKYKEEVLRQMFDVLIYNKKHSLYPCDKEKLLFSITSARENMGRVTLHGQKYYIWDVVQSRTPVVHVVWTGNSRTNLTSVVEVIDWEFIVDSIEQKLEIAEIKKYAEMNLICGIYT